MAWNAKVTGAYGRESQEAYDNAIMAWNLLGSMGWTAGAVAGMWGNVESESGYNPWRWESDNVLASTQIDIIQNSRVNGYGLGQFTPSGKYILSSIAMGLNGYAPNFSDRSGSPNDGNAQLLFIDGYADYYPTQAYPLSYSEYKESKETPSYLARAWVYNYERPADPSATIENRMEAANYWYTVFTGEDPKPPSPEHSKKSMKLWMMLRKPIF